MRFLWQRRGLKHPFSINFTSNDIIDFSLQASAYLLFLCVSHYQAAQNISSYPLTHTAAYTRGPGHIVGAIRTSHPAHNCSIDEGIAQVSD